MASLETINERARNSPRRIVLPEGADLRIVQGACRAAQDGIAKIILLGDERGLREVVRAICPSDAPIAIVDPVKSDLFEAYAECYFELRKDKAGSREGAVKAMQQPLDFAAMMVRRGDADGMVAGATMPTADVIRAAKRVIGMASHASFVSSFFLMILDRAHHAKNGTLVFADCGLAVEPDAQELAEIAIASARSFKDLTGETPKVAMLSFSTHGSAKHDRVTKVVKAARIVRELDPSLLIDGELQFDAAFVPSVNASKAPNSVTRGDANVFVFPNLESANIGYKIAERIGGATAIGPVLQGLAKPANDLSRGCSADDVYNLIALTVVQCIGMD